MGAAEKLPDWPLVMTEDEEEIARLRDVLSAAGTLAETIVVRETTGRPWGEFHMQTIHRRIRDAAGLPKRLTPTSFRHGGITELGDAGVEDVRPISGHDQIKTTAIYNKATVRKARRAAALRRTLIDAGGTDSE